jgi:hypothetical protein
MLRILLAVLSLRIQATGHGEGAVRQMNIMPASSKLVIMEAERRFSVHIRIGVLLEGLGGRLGRMRAWLDGNCGADGWALTLVADARHAK